jgi:small subunit ribosomal protein S6
MKKYNLFVLLSNLSNEEVKVIQGQISEIVKRVGGKIESIEETGKRKLSYTIKKVRHGFYLDYILSLAKDKVGELKNELKLNSSILRFELSLFKPKIVKLPKPTVKKEAKKVEGEKKEKSKISMDELNKKLDNILESENI